MGCSETFKVRELYFHRTPPGQVDDAYRLLEGIVGLEVARSARPDCLIIRYEVTEYTLEGLENALIAQGFHLSSTLLIKLKRAMIYYCESVQRCNTAILPRQTKQTNSIYIKAWEHHPHGDSDATPKEWREYR